MKKRIKNIDPLRGFLALCVVIAHIPLISNTVGLPNFSDSPIFHRGANAVHVFFALSGYLIIGLIYDEKDTYGSINIKNFYIRRILRLYPVYYFVLFFGFFFYHYLLPALGIQYDTNYSLAVGMAWCIGFFPNIFKSLYSPGAILDVLWSIGIEEQFYLMVAPVLSLLPIKKYFKYLLIFTAVYFVLFHTPLFSFLKSFRFFYFFMSAGGLIAIMERSKLRMHFNSVYLRLCVYVAFILYFTTNLFFFQNDLLRNGVEVVLFNLLIVNLANDNWLQIKSRLLNYIGQISYGIYMYHMIVVNFVLFVFLRVKDKLLLEDWQIIVLINISCIILTILLSHLSYKYFESYFLGLKEKFRDNKPRMKIIK